MYKILMEMRNIIQINNPFFIKNMMIITDKNKLRRNNLHVFFWYRPVSRISFYGSIIKTLLLKIDIFLIKFNKLDQFFLSIYNWWHRYE